jgi:NADPH:quinone reductase-like Zn-dependent oxidoreductase
MGTPAEFDGMLALFDGPLTPIVDRVYPLLAAPDAHRRMDQADQFGKMVLEIA